MLCVMGKKKKGYEFSDEFCSALDDLGDQYQRPVTKAAILEAAFAFLRCMPHDVQQLVIVTSIVSSGRIDGQFPMLLDHLVKACRRDVSEKGSPAGDFERDLSEEIESHRRSGPGRSDKRPRSSGAGA